MNGEKTPLGYTIVEVMIVLAVSSFMFLIAANFISGKQAHTAFAVGVNEMGSRLQDAIEQVNDGHYSDKQFSCVSSGGNLSFPTSAQTQGTNSGCVFLGKFMHFTQGTKPTDYEVFSLAGNRLQTDGKTPVVDLVRAHPTPVIGPGIDLTVHRTTAQNLNIGKVQILAGGSLITAYGFGLIQGLGVASTADTSGSTLDSGAQHVSLVYAPALNTPNQPESAASSLITGNLAAADSAIICITDDVRYATITLGLNGNQLSVSTKMGLTACP